MTAATPCAARVEFAGPDRVRRQDLGDLPPSAFCTANFSVRFDGRDRWNSAFGTTYGVTLRFTGGVGGGGADVARLG